MCQQVDVEDQEFEEEFLSQEDPSMLHFLLASGEEVSWGRGQDTKHAVHFTACMFESALIVICMCHHLDCVLQDLASTPSQVCIFQTQLVK